MGLTGVANPMGPGLKRLAASSFHHWLLHVPGKPPSWLLRHANDLLDLESLTVSAVPATGPIPVAGAGSIPAGGPAKSSSYIASKYVFHCLS